MEGRETANEEKAVKAEEEAQPKPEDKRTTTKKDEPVYEEAAWNGA